MTKHRADNNKRATGKPVCMDCHYFVPKACICRIRFETKGEDGRALPADDCTPMHRKPYFVQCNKFDPKDEYDETTTG